MSQFFTLGGQSIDVSALASVLPMNIQKLFPLGWTGWISLSSRDSQESSPVPQFKSINSFQRSAFFIVQLSHPYMTTRKTVALTRWTFVGNSSAFGCNVLKISMRSISSNVSFKTCVSFLIFYFDKLSIGVSGVLKSPTIIVLLSISPFMSVSVYLMY